MLHILLVNTREEEMHEECLDLVKKEKEYVCQEPNLGGIDMKRYASEYMVRTVWMIHLKYAPARDVKGQYHIRQILGETVCYEKCLPV